MTAMSEKSSKFARNKFIGAILCHHLLQTRL